MGASTNDEMKIVWQTTDNGELMDLADNVVSLNDNNFAMSEVIATLVAESNSLNEGNGIVIDGYFGDWNGVVKQFNLVSSDAYSEHIDLQNYAAI